MEVKKKKHRDYDNDYGSVTQILGVMRKIGLEIWFKQNTLDFCNRESKRGKEIGSQTHEVIQSHIEKEEIKIETEYAEEISNTLKSFAKFKKEHPEIILQKAEIKLVNEQYGYNGTMDCLATVNGKLVIADWKTGKCKVGEPKEVEKPPVYDESFAQVAAYFMSYNDLNEKKLEGAYILVIAKDKVAYNLIELTVEDVDVFFHRIFLPALKIYNCQKAMKDRIKELKKGV